MRRFTRRCLAAALALSMAAPGPAFATGVARVPVAGEAGLTMSLALPRLEAPATNTPPLTASAAGLTPSLLTAPTAAQAATPDPRAALAGAARQTVTLTPTSSGSESKAQAGRAFEGASERRAAAFDVAGSESSGPKALPRSEKTAPPGGNAPPDAKAGLLAGIRNETAPGTIATYAKVGEIGARLGLDPEKTGTLFTELLQEGHLAMRDNKDTVYFSFRARVDAPAHAPAPEHAADVLASNAVALLNSANPADHARAVAQADRAVAAYEKAGQPGQTLPQLEEAKVLRANAMLEFFSGFLGAHKKDLESLKTLTPKLTERVADLAEALAWLKTATYQAGYVPPMPARVHRKLVALVDSLDPLKKDGRPAEDEVADGYIAALLLLEQFDARDFLYEGPTSKTPAPEESWTPSGQQTAAFAAQIRAHTSAGETVAPETLTRAGKALGLDMPQMNAAIFALAARGELLVLANGKVVYFDLIEQAGNSSDNIWELHNEAIDAIKLANAPDAASHLRAVARLDAVFKKYSAHKGLSPKSKALEQVSIALGNAKLEAITSSLRLYEKTLGSSLSKDPLDVVRLCLSLLSNVHYAAERRQNIGADLAAGLDAVATLEVLRKAVGDKKDAELARGAELTRAFIENLKFSKRGNRSTWVRVLKKPAEHRAADPKDGRGGSLDSIEALQAKMKAIGMPEAIQEITTREYEKMAQMAPRDSETQKVRTYIEWLIDVPWSRRTEDVTDIAAARGTLDRDHAGLEKVKERVLEFLAVRKRTGSKKGAIIAFTGPPGVGKTSIAAAIAQALGRKFVRLSLGGVHDETVLRGHGRTYVGSMPGEIMRQMRAAGTVNPVMLMDEVDKMGRNSNAGDPTAALLEILDPKQNNTFRDRYLDVPYDLSEVLFIVTANELSNIPGPLRDRVELIEFEGYTTLEKIAIAERHLVPQELEEAGLKAAEATLTKGALRRLIEGYTMEAGVRGLREKVASVLRKISAWIETRGENVPGVVDEKDIAHYLGGEEFSPRQMAQNGVGVATGLAVNDYGGSTLNVEAWSEPGTGKLTLRKQFGQDIEDSAKNAYAYVRKNAAKFGLEKIDFTKIDMDINITPAGKIDGPSAGSLMVTAILSDLTGRSVVAGLAMTGEITKRGDVLPIGGLKQKVMAAHRMGYTEVIFPFANLKDLEGIPKEVRDAVKLTAVRTYDEIYQAAIVPADKAP